MSADKNVDSLTERRVAQLRAIKTRSKDQDEELAMLEGYLSWINAKDGIASEKKLHKAALPVPPRQTGPAAAAQACPPSDRRAGPAAPGGGDWEQQAAEVSAMAADPGALSGLRAGKTDPT